MTQDEVKEFAMSAMFGKAVFDNNPDKSLLGASPEWFRDMQDQDEDLSFVRTLLEAGLSPEEAAINVKRNDKLVSREARQLLSQLDPMYIDKRGLLRLRIPCNFSDQIREPLCVPISAADYWAKVVHEMGGHMGVDKTAMTTRGLLNFSRLRAVVADAMANCLPCQKSHGKGRPQQ
jgi:hypothetical protein